jgi:type IV secretory pathway VirB6-like protein
MAIKGGKIAAAIWGVLWRILRWAKLLAIPLVVISLIAIIASAAIPPFIGSMEPSAKAKDRQGNPLLVPCISADDFGYLKAAVFAKPQPVSSGKPNLGAKTTGTSVEEQESFVRNRYASGNFGRDVTLSSEDQIFGERENQVVLWTDSDLLTTGDDLIVDAEGQWTSWFNGKSVPQNKICILDRAPRETLGYPTACPNDANLNLGKNEAVYMLANDPKFNASCWFSYGYGAYALFADKALSPNGTESFNWGKTENGQFTRGVLTPTQLEKIRNNEDNWPTLHMFGDIGTYEIDGKNVNVFGELYSPLPENAKKDQKIWLRIQDRYYEDNAGFYFLKFKQGAKRPQPGPIESLIKFTKETMFGTARGLYKHIVYNSGFQAAVNALLVLYVAFAATGFLMGWVKITQAELVMRLIKIGIIFALIGPGSWEFFNTYLFTFFLEGVDTLSQIVVQSAIGAGSLGNGPAFFDQILLLFFSPETNAKILSTFFVSWAGFVYIVAMYTSLLLFLYIVARMIIVYLMAIIPTALLLIVAPIFICCMLFQATSKYFKAWLEQMLAYGMQTFIAMAALALFSAVILDYLERTIGYRVCYRCIFCPVFDFTWLCPSCSPGEWAFSLFGGPEGVVHDYTNGLMGAADGIKVWQADIRTSAEAQSVTEALYLTDQRFYDEKFPGYLGYIWMDADRTRAGLEIVFRNPMDMPYFDPVLEAKEIQFRLSGNMISFLMILVFIIIMLLFVMLVTQIPQIGNEIATGAIRAVDLMAVSDSVFDGLKSMMAKTLSATGAMTVLEVVKRQTIGTYTKAISDTFRKDVGFLGHITGLESKFQTDKKALQGMADDALAKGNMNRFEAASDALIAKDIRDLVRQENYGSSALAKGVSQPYDTVIGDRKGFDGEIRQAVRRYEQGADLATSNYSLKNNPVAMDAHMKALHDALHRDIGRSINSHMNWGAMGMNSGFNQDFHNKLDRILEDRLQERKDAGLKVSYGDKVAPELRRPIGVDSKMDLWKAADYDAQVKRDIQGREDEKKRNEDRREALEKLEKAIAEKNYELEQAKKNGLSVADQYKIKDDRAEIHDRYSALQAIHKNEKKAVESTVETMDGYKKRTPEEKAYMKEEYHYELGLQKEKPTIASTPGAEEYNAWKEKPKESKAEEKRHKKEEEMNKRYGYYEDSKATTSAKDDDKRKKKKKEKKDGDPDSMFYDDDYK